MEAQLMLLEQQNKKRLLMARQEQDTISSQPKSFQVNGQATREQGNMPYQLGGGRPDGMPVGLPG